MKRPKARFTCIALASVSMLATTPALADGMPGSVSWGEAVVLVPSTWSGFYAGGHLGGALDQRSFTIQDLSTDQDLSLPSPSEDQILIGLHGGYNWQVQQIVLGVEADVSFANDANYLASIRGRLGFAPWDRLLLYGTAGAAFINVDEPFTIQSGNQGPSVFNLSRTETGFVAGGGGEYRVLPNTSLGAEALFYDFGSSSTLLSTPPDVGGEPFFFKDDLNFWVVRGRLTYYFNDH
jgi:outer membrane immunogenic protein